MKLEIGKRYVTRDGRVTGPLEASGSERYPCKASVPRADGSVKTENWTEDGRFDASITDDTCYDLVKEFEEPTSIVEGPKPTAKHPLPDADYKAIEDRISRYVSDRTTADMVNFVEFEQQTFDLCIGRLDRILSELVGYGKGSVSLDIPNQQTLKHHAEDIIAAGEKILKDLGL